MNFAFNFGGQGDSATNHPAIADLTVRQAIAHAIDKQALVDKVLLGKGTASAGLHDVRRRVPGIGTPPSRPRSTRSISTSRPTMLEEAGYLDTDGDGVRETPNGGEPLSWKWWRPRSAPSAPWAGELIAEWLGEIGIDVRVKAVGDGANERLLGRGDFDAYIWGWNADPDPNYHPVVFTSDRVRGLERWLLTRTLTTTSSTSSSATCSSVDDRAAFVADMQSFVYDNVPGRGACLPRVRLQAFRNDRSPG